MKVCLDSRLIKPGEYFVPIKGENFDGHKFIDSALENGAAGVIEEQELYALASQKLSRLKPIVIAVTGSVGKSTMTNFLKTLISTKYNVCLGNLNTRLGLATNIINDMDEGCEIFIAECGMDHAGELEETSEFIKPDVVVVTNISESHLEKLGSLEAIKEAKMELTYHIKPHGRIFLNWENENIKDAIKYIPHTLSEDVKVVKYGSCADSDFQNIDLEKFLATKLSTLKLRFIGLHNYLNLLGATIISIELGITKDNLIEGLEKLETPKGRLRILEGVNDSILVDDTYNSSPVSCMSAIESVSQYYKDHRLTGRKIAILGSMLELGAFEDEGHRTVGHTLVRENFDLIFLVGELAKKILPQSSNYFDNSKATAEEILERIKPLREDIILIKGSQGIRMERITKALMKNPVEAEKLLVRQDSRWV